MLLHTEIDRLGIEDIQIWLIILRDARSLVR